MSFIVFVEALKFHKLRQAWVARGLFLAFILLNLLPFGYVSGLRQFQRFLDQSLLFLQEPSPEQLELLSAQVNGPLLVFLGLQLLLFVLGFLLVYLYASAYYAERQGLAAGLGLSSLLLASPQLLLLLLFILLISFFSSWLLFAPALFVLLSWGYGPLLQAELRMKRRLRQAWERRAETEGAEAVDYVDALPPFWPQISAAELEQLPPELLQRIRHLQRGQREDQLGTGQAWKLSYSMSRGRRLFFLLTGLAIYLLFARFGPALAQLMRLEGLGYALLLAFFQAVYALMLGRLLGLYYYISREQLRPGTPSSRSVEEFYRLVTGEEVQRERD